MVNKFKFYYEYVLIGATRTNMLEHPDPGLNLPVHFSNGGNTTTTYIKLGPDRSKSGTVIKLDYGT